jgi:hypothetical protein
MLSVSATQTWAVAYSLERSYIITQARVRAQGAQSCISREETKDLLAVLDAAEPLCRDLELAHCLSRLNHFKIALIANPFNSVVASEILGLRVSIVEEASDRKFAFIPADKTVFFEHESLFGDAVNEAFPSAAPEIKDAGNCLAADLNTAAVFHFMRVAEYGLRGLARRLKVKVKGTLEYAAWGNVLAAIGKKLTAAQNKPRGKKKSEELEFYRLAESELNTLKDVWRNNVMHTRRRYNQPEALGVYIRVQEFMERLATKVREVS